MSTNSDAEVTAAFASAWTARIQDAEVTAPKAAKPLHFPRREPAEDLVEDVDEVQVPPSA